MKNFFKKIARIVLKLFLWFSGLSIAWVIFNAFVPVPVTYLMLDRCFEQWWNDKEVRLEKEWVPIEEISPHLQQALIASEDQRFREHRGFDFDAIEKAMKYNGKKRKKKKVRGASTISQQTAKNVFLWPGRSWLRKGFEVYFTLLIELFWSKERILEVYLNVMETGDGYYGAEAAARHYFKKSAKTLSESEAALIAAVIPNPRKWNPARPTPYILKRQQWIIRNMHNLGEIDWEESEEDSEK